MEFLKVLLPFLIIFSSYGEDFLSSLPLSYKDCRIKKNHIILSKNDLALMKSQLSQSIASGIFKKYDFSCGDVRYEGYILSDKVRTHYQTILFLLGKNKIQELVLLDFTEPIQYRAPSKWLEKFKLIDFKKNYTIDALSGATLTRQSTIKLLKQAFYLEKI